ncbi:hypothetical protein [Streptomyces sp. NPDC048438]|uniref:hypothetical protein n=1 Tax=Streptomyces sp. NPDC048438 TaxID=3365551 RepID=UPI003715756A
MAEPGGGGKPSPSLDQSRTAAPSPLRQLGRRRPGKIHLTGFDQRVAQLFRLGRADSCGQHCGALEQGPGVPTDIGVVLGAGAGDRRRRGG